MILDNQTIIKMKKKIIITYLINSFESGGTENQLLNLVKLLKKQFIIKIFSFSDGILSREFRKEGIEITIGNNGYSIFFTQILHHWRYLDFA